MWVDESMSVGTPPRSWEMRGCIAPGLRTLRARSIVGSIIDRHRIVSPPGLHYLAGGAGPPPPPPPRDIRLAGILTKGPR